MNSQCWFYYYYFIFIASHVSVVCISYVRWAGVDFRCYSSLGCSVVHSKHTFYINFILWLVCMWHANGKPSYCGGHGFEKDCLNIEEALQKRKTPKTLLIANNVWRHSIKFSIIFLFFPKLNFLLRWSNLTETIQR